MIDPSSAPARARPTAEHPAAVDPAAALPTAGRRHAVQRWRTRMKARRATATAYRIGIGLVGGAIVLLGLVLVPLPGPGWLIVFIGLSVLATEFVWAERLLGYARQRVTGWTQWIGRRSLVFRLLIGFSGVAFLVAAVVAYAIWSGWLANPL